MELKRPKRENENEKTLESCRNSREVSYQGRRRGDRKKEIGKWRKEEGKMGGPYVGMVILPKINFQLTIKNNPITVLIEQIK